MSNYNNNKKKDSKGKKGNNYKKTPAPKTETKENKSYDTMCTNDISWYNKMSNLFNRATQIPFNRILGDNMADPPMLAGPATTDTYWGRNSMPIIMRINYVPGIGVCTDYNDAPNRAFQAMYSALLTKTSTSTLPFAAPNLALYTICAQSIAQNIGVAKRILETTRIYTPDNLGLPKMYIYSQLGNQEAAQDVLDHVGEYEWQLNNLIRDFNSLRIPNFIDTFKRQYFLAHSYFMDNDTVASQAYVFCPTVYYVFNDLGKKLENNTYDGIARAVSKTKYSGDFPTILEEIKEQIAALRSSKDFTSINGTLKRAFESSDFVQIDELTGSETPNFLVDEVMAYQIHNLVPCDIMTNALNDMVADYEKDIVTYNPYATADPGTFANSRSVILNTFENSVTPDWIMESTRLIALVGDNESMYSCGTEIVQNCRMYYFEYNAAGQMVNATNVILEEAGFDVSEDQDLSRPYHNTSFAWAMLDKFHRAPRYPIYGTMEVPANNDLGFEEATCVVGITGDLHFYTFAPRDAIKRLHDTALLSIFDTSASMNVK